MPVSTLQLGLGKLARGSAVACAVLPLLSNTFNPSTAGPKHRVWSETSPELQDSLSDLASRVYTPFGVDVPDVGDDCVR